MVSDLRRILFGWEFEPGKISVRKIMGQGGREKIQTRVDLGVLQFEPQGRPDGTRPRGCESLLAHYQKRLAALMRERQSDDDFVLSESDCRALRQEAHQYYQRFLSLFVLEDFDGVARDTRHNLRIIELCVRHAADGFDRAAAAAHHTYTVMMNTRARAYIALAERDFDRAAQVLRSGWRRIRELRRRYRREVGLTRSVAVERRVLSELYSEVFQRMPEDHPRRVAHELKRALRREDYESAARIRDRLSDGGAPASRP